MTGNVMEYTDDVLTIIREGKEPEQVEEPQGEEVHESKYEDKARAEGWTDIEEWKERGNDPEDWVDAGEFVRRGELMTRIKGQTKAIKSSNKRIQELESAIQTMADHNKKIAKIEYDKARKSLMKQKLEAIDDRDHDTVLEIEDQITTLDSEAEKALGTSEAESPNQPAQVSQDDIPEVLQNWMNKPDNSWYTENPELRAEADKIATQFGKTNFNQNGDIDDQPWDDLLDYVDQYIRARHPEQFGGVVEEENLEEEAAKPKQRRRPAVAEPGQRGNRGAKNKKGLSVNDLSEEEKSAYTEFVVRQKVMSSEEYLKQLEEIRSN